MIIGHDGREVANFVLDFCERRAVEITHLDLQKIVYFCHVWSLVVLRRPLIRHKFEAWDFGPVLPYLYREFRTFNRASIKCRAMRIDPATGEKRVVQYNFDQETKAHLEEIVAFYSRLSTNHLVELSHVKGGPWYKVWYHGGSINPGMKINDDDISEFYSKVSHPFSMQ